MGRKPNDINRIKKKLEDNTIKDSATGCWTYQGATSNGTHCTLRYYAGKRIYIHRLSANIHWGFDLESSMQILHWCNNPRCWNPEHLYEGTHDDNMRDKVEATTHCKRGHEFTEENTRIREGVRYCRACDRMRHGYL